MGADDKTTRTATLVKYLAAAGAEVDRWKSRAVKAINELAARREEVWQLKKKLAEAEADLARAESGERVRLDQERIERLVEECSAAWTLVAQLEAKLKGEVPPEDDHSLNATPEEIGRRILELGEDPEVLEGAVKDLATRMKVQLDPHVMHALARIYHARLHGRKGSEYEAKNWWVPVECAFIHLFRERPDIEADIKAEMQIEAGIGNPDSLYGDEDEGPDSVD
jgi:hypothetical protein